MRRLAAVWSLLLLCAAPAGCGEHAHRRAAITVTPASGLFDRARSITITGLAPGEVVTVTAISQRADGTWTASASFRAPSSGTVDLGRRAPLSGSYRGVSPMGLLWSERLVAPGSGPLSGVVVSTLTVSARGRALASTRLTQLLGTASLIVQPAVVSSQGFAGEYFTSAGGATRRPAVVVWGGSEGGLGDGAAKAALLAAHGIPSLALAYFDEPGL